MFAFIAAVLFFVFALLIIGGAEFIAVVAMFFIAMGTLCLHFAFQKPVPNVRR